MTASGNTLKKEYVNPITHGVIWKQLLLYFVPLLLSSFLQLCYNTADTIIVGRYVGKIALTAVGGSAGQIYAMVTEFMIGASGGAAVIMSQAYGARNKKLLDDGLHNAVALALAMGALFTVTGLLVSKTALVTAGAPAETMAGSLMYLRIAFAGLIPCALYNMGAGVLRAAGNSKRPLRFLVISIGLNIALDLLFVAVLHLGIGGAALATILTQTLSAALVLRALMKGAGKAEREGEALSGGERRGGRELLSGGIAEGSGALQSSGTAEGRGMPLCGSSAEQAGALLPPLDLRRLRLQENIALKMLRLGIPLGLETLMYTFSCVVLTSAVNTFGTDTVAAYAGFVRIESFYWMLEQALAVSITTFVGQNLGAGLYGRVRSVSRQGAALMYIFMGTAIVIMYAGCPVWLGLFTTDPDVLKIGVEMMRYLLPFYILYVPDGVFFSTLRGMGDSLRPALITFIGVCVLRILWVLFVFPQFPTMRALLFCFPVSWSVTAVIYAVYYSWYRKNVICITGGSS